MISYIDELSCNLIVTMKNNNPLVKKRNMEVRFGDDSKFFNLIRFCCFGGYATYSNVYLESVKVLLDLRSHAFSTNLVCIQLMDTFLRIVHLHKNQKHDMFIMAD